MIGNIPKVYYFTDRKKIAEEIQLPENNDFAPYMIISPNEVGTGYKQLEYDKYKFWFNVHMTKDELKKMILGFNSAHTFALSKQKEYELHSDTNFCWKFIRLISLVSFMIAAFIFVYVKLYDSSFKEQKKALQISFFAALMAVMTSILLTLMSCKSIPKFKTYQFFLEKRLTKVLDHFNKKLDKKGLKVLPGKKFVWIEIWKTRHQDGDKAPIISLIGRPPIVDYTPESLNDMVAERNRELQETFKRRYNTKYKRLEYLEEFYSKATERREIERKIENKRVEEAMRLAKEEAMQLALVPERSAIEESSDPHFNAKQKDQDKTILSGQNQTEKDMKINDQADGTEQSHFGIAKQDEKNPGDHWDLPQKDDEPLAAQHVNNKVNSRDKK